MALAVLQVHGLQPRQRTPRVVEVAVRERQHVHVARLERLAEGVGFQPTALVSVAGLEALSGVNDGNTVGSLDQTPADAARSGVGRADAVPST